MTFDRPFAKKIIRRLQRMISLMHQYDGNRFALVSKLTRSRLPPVQRKKWSFQEECPFRVDPPGDSGASVHPVCVLLRGDLRPASHRQVQSHNRRVPEGPGSGRQIRFGPLFPSTDQGSRSRKFCQTECMQPRSV